MAITTEGMLSILHQKHNNRFQYPDFKLEGGPKQKLKIICPEHRII